MPNVENYIQVQATKELAKYLGNKLDELKKATRVEMDMRPLEKTMDNNSRAIAQLLARLEFVLSKIKEPKFTGEVKIDGSQFQRELREIVSEIRKMGDNLTKKMPDNSALERGIKMLLDKEQDNSKILSALEDVKDAIVKKQFNIPDTIKIEENQLRSIRSGGVSFGGGGSSAMQGRRATVQNTSLTADTEASYTFPANTVAWIIKTREQNVKLLYAWSTGTLPVSGTGAKYMTVPQNFLRSQDNVDYSNKTIFLQAASSSTAEIESFQA